MMRRLMALAAPCAGIVSLVVAGAAGAATLQISPTGADSGNCQITACLTITYALTQAATGDTLALAPGTFVENVVLDKGVVLAGSGEAATTIQPAISDPNCGGSGGGSLCGASNVLLVRANNVEIRDLTIDGDNPGLTSGVVSAGADLDARNGIITDHTSGAAPFTGLNVHDVTVKNVYLRGMYASTAGGTFTFTHNTVQNVQADPASICLFNFGGSGTMWLNTVSGCGDALAANWSRGTLFLGNVITASNSAVHSDNAGGQGTVGFSDLIDSNQASNLTANSYAFWTFASYIAPTVRNNTATVPAGAMVGLGAFGANGGVRPLFQNNTVDCASQSGSRGAWISTTLFNFGQRDIDARLTGNRISHCDEGIRVDAGRDAGDTYRATVTGSGNTVLGSTTSGIAIADLDLSPPEVTGVGEFDVAFDRNRLFGNAVGLRNTTTATVQTVAADQNWWGCNAGPGGAGALGPCDTVVGTATFAAPLVLAAPVVTPTAIPVPGSATVTAALAGVPDLTPGTFTTALVGGSFTPPSTTSVGGQLASSLGVTAAGSGAACVAVDNERLCSPTFTAGQAPAFTSANQTTFVVGVPGTFTVTTTGNPTPSLARTGTLPAAVSFVDNGDGTATLAGTPTFATGGTYPLTLTASNGVDTGQAFTLHVEAGDFFTVAPCRLFDSRLPADGPALASGVARLVQVTGKCGIPAYATAISVNLTAVMPIGQGALQAYAGDQTAPGTIVLAFNALVSRANNGILQLALDGTGSVKLLPTVNGGGPVDILVDVNGYFN